MSLEKEIPSWVTEYNSVPNDSTGRRVSRFLGGLILKGDRKIDSLQWVPFHLNGNMPTGDSMLDRSLKALTEAEALTKQKNGN